MEIVGTTSAKWKLDAQDFLKGAVVAIGAAVALPLQAWVDSLATGSPLTLNFKYIAMTGVGAFVSYLIKNLFTSAKTIVNPNLSNSKP